MTSQPTISVRGEARLEVDPELAVVQVTVMARDKERQRALDLLARRNEQILTLIRAHGAAVERLDSSPAHVSPVVKDAKARERITGYVAQAGVTVTVGDFSVLGDLVMKLADQEMVTVTGPWWQLRVDSPTRRQARLAAAQDAMVRAREYAAAFGGRISGLLEVADQHLLTTAREPGPTFMRAAAATGIQAEAAPAEFDFEPAKQTVSAQVEARFTMTAPGLDA
jgi:uncharacterized protein YggE